MTVIAKPSIIAICFWAVFSAPSRGIASESQSLFALTGEKYALEDWASTRLDFNLDWKSEDQTDSGKFNRELKIFSFFENGKTGDKSFDVDRIVFRLSSGEQGHFWLGRSMPLNEGDWQDAVFTTSAVGANWVQNQSNPLEPRVAGWIGAGWYATVDDLRFTVAMSPIFLPSFGPRLDLSEVDGASGSRFARLPPQFVNSERELVAIRYKINSGSLAKIVIQQQALLAAEKDTPVGAFRVLGWTAPAPDPQVDVSDVIRVNSVDADALVTATPRFPRENFIGLQWRLSKHSEIPLIELEEVYEINSRRLAVSALLKPFNEISFGFLNTLEMGAKDNVPSPVAEPAPYESKLVWFEVVTDFFEDRLRPSLRVEHHYGEKVSDLWLNPKLSLRPANRFFIFAAASILAGQNGSYLGEWRGLDSVYSGLRYAW